MSVGVSVRYEGDVAIIDMIAGKNEFTFEFIQQLHDALDEILRNPDAAGVITVGKAKFYSNGIDLVAMAQEEPHRRTEFMEHLCKLFNRILTFPLPTIAAINGHAFAGGCLMALAHDHRVMNSDKGWVCLPEVRMPSTFPPFLLELAKTKLPPGRAHTDIIVMGKRCPAAHAQRIGAVDEIAPSNDLLNVALTLMADQLALGTYGRKIMKDMKEDLYKNISVLCTTYGSVTKSSYVAKL